MIVGGVVVETGLEKVVEGVRGQGKVSKRPTGAADNGPLGSIGMGGRGVWAGR